MMSGDETFLEAFVESLSALPHDVKRSLELLRDLDGRCGEGTSRLLRLQQQYLEESEARMMRELEVVVRQKRKQSFSPTPPVPVPVPVPLPGAPVNVDDDDNGAVLMDVEEEPPTSAEDPAPGGRDTSSNYAVGIRVLGQGSKAAAVIPTTLELERYVHQRTRDPNDSRPLFKDIMDLQKVVLQLADEKVAVARQLYDRMDNTVKRLDKDLAEMEMLLQTSGDFSTAAAAASSSVSTAVAGKPNDLAACQVSPGSEWILAKVLQHDPTTGTYRLADEDVESNKVFHLPESQVVLCGVDKLSKGDVVFCVYPDTTSFYQATVVQAPRKNQAAAAAASAAGGGASAAGSFVMVNFVDDSDEFGITHDKAVPLRHVIYPPYGATIK